MNLPKRQIDYSSMQKVHPKQFISSIIMLFVLIAGGVMIGIVYPVYMMFAEDPFWLPWILSLVVGVLGIFIMRRVYSDKRTNQLASVVGYFSFVIIGFMLFDIVINIFPSLFNEMQVATLKNSLGELKFITIVFAGGVGGIFALITGIISLTVRYSKKERKNSAKPLVFLVIYGLTGLIIMQILMQAGSMSDGIEYLSSHPVFDSIISLMLGGSVLVYALRYISLKPASKDAPISNRPTMLTLDTEDGSIGNEKDNMSKQQK